MTPPPERRVVLVGGGGHARVVADALREQGDVVLEGYTDVRETGLPGLPYLGDDASLAELDAEEVALALGVGALRDGRRREELHRRLEGEGFTWISVVHPSAVVSRDHRAAGGVQVMARAVVQAGSILGRGAIVNTGAIVEHDCRVEDFAHVGPGAVLGGEVHVGEAAVVGVGARVLPGVSIGAGATVAAGAVVAADVAPGEVVRGVPARPSPEPPAAPPTRRTGGPIPLSVPFMTGDEWPAVKACLDEEWVSTAGPHVDRFAAQFAGRLGVARAVPLNSGTSAIHLALLAAGVGPGDRVLVPSLTFIASVNPIRYLGAEPVFVECSPEIPCLDPAKVEEALAELEAEGAPPAAVIVVHLYGHPVDMDPILESCGARGVPVIEDATEALGSLYKGRPVGTLGRVGCFSFNGNKIITTGSGGMAVTADPELAERIRYLGDQAKDDPVRFVHAEVGYNYRMTSLQASLGAAQLAHLDEFLIRKRQIAARYEKELGDLPGVTPCPEAEWAENCFWNCFLRVDPDAAACDAEGLLVALREAEIHGRPFFTPIHRLPPYAAVRATSMDRTERWAREGVVLPCSVGLTDADQARVIAAVRRRLGRGMGEVR